MTTFQYTVRQADRSLGAIAHRFRTTPAALDALTPGTSSLTFDELVDNPIEIPIPPDEAPVLGATWLPQPAPHEGTLGSFVHRWRNGDGKMKLGGGVDAAISLAWFHWRNRDLRDACLRPENPHLPELSDDPAVPGDVMLKPGDNVWLPLVQIEHYVSVAPATTNGTDRTATVNTSRPILAALWGELSLINQQVDALGRARTRMLNWQAECTAHATAIRVYSDFVSKRAWEYDEGLVPSGKEGRHAYRDRLRELCAATDYALLNTDGAWSTMPASVGATADSKHALSSLVVLLRSASAVALLDTCVPLLRSLPDAAPLWSGASSVWVAADGETTAGALDLIFDLIAAAAHGIAESEDAAQISEFFDPLISILKNETAPDPNTQNFVGYVCALAVEESQTNFKTAFSAASFIGAVLSPYLAVSASTADKGRIREALEKVEAATLSTLRPALLELGTRTDTFENALEDLKKLNAFQGKVRGTFESAKKALGGETKWSGPKAAADVRTDEELLRDLEDAERARAHSANQAQEIYAVVLERKLLALNEPKGRLRRAYAAVSRVSPGLFATCGIAWDIYSVAGSIKELKQEPTAKGAFEAAKGIAELAKGGVEAAVKFKWMAEAAARPLFKVLGRVTLVLSVGSEAVEIVGAFVEHDYLGATGHALVAAGSVLICVGPVGGPVTIVVASGLMVAGYVVVYRQVLWQIVVPDVVLEHERVIPPLKTKFSIPAGLTAAIGAVESAFEASHWSGWKTDGNVPNYGAYDADPSKSPAAERRAAAARTPLDIANAQAGR